ncbi:MAG TPA: hypothetical protein VJQ45_11500 [Ktedonobacterales bacterium]|nr:hypothetical protein [Ktedonobacterales bacterium]
MIEMCGVRDEYAVPYRVGSASVLSVRLAAHLDQEVTWLETKALELTLEGWLLITEQLVIALPFNGHMDFSLG